MSSAIVTFDSSGIVIGWNEPAERLYGLRAEVILGQPRSRLFPSNPESGTAEVAEAVHRDGAGGELRVRIRRTVVRDPAGAPVAVTEVHEPVAGTAPPLPSSPPARESDAYPAAFHFAPIPMSIATLEDGLFVDANREYCRLIGYAREELVGRQCTELALTAPEMKNAIQGAVGREGRVWEMQGVFHARDGRAIPCQYYGERIRAGGRELLISIVLDVSEQKRAQAEREQTVRLVRLLSSHAPLEEMLEELKALLRECSGWDEVSVLTDGAAAGGAPGYASEELFPMWCGDRQVGALRLRNRVERTLSEPARSILNKAARSLAVALEHRRLDESLRKREEQYRLLLEAIPDVVVHSDPEGRVLYISPAARAFLEPEQEEMIGRSYRDIGLSEENQALCRRVLGEVAAQRSPGEVEMCLQMKSGPVWFDVRVLPELDASGTVTRVLSLFRDITVRKKADAERLRLEEELAAAHRLESLGRLAGGVAHDFNNLLTVINGYAETALKQMPEGDAWRPAMREILQAGDRAAMLVRQLLAFGRKQVLRHERLDLNRLITEIENSLLKLAGEHIRIETKLGARSRVIADPNQMAQVLINLVANARDAMLDGGTVTIETRDSRLPGGRGRDGRCETWVAVTVRDTGYGMDEKTLRHIFEPFFTTKEVGKGTGLGLAMVQGIIGQSGGHVLVDSAPGKGTEVCFYLRAAGACEEETKPEPVEVPGGPETILLAEDQDSVRRFTAEALRAAGYRVLEAGGASEAVPQLAAHAVDLLITDLVMPGASGRMLARLARELVPGLPVLFISGHPSDLGGGDEADNPCLPFLAKPFSPQDLAEAVRRALDGASA